MKLLMESTSLDMLSIILYRILLRYEKLKNMYTYTPALGFVAVSFSLRPRERNGAMRERAGESTSETKV